MMYRFRMNEAVPPTRCLSQRLTVPLLALRLWPKLGAHVLRGWRKPRPELYSAPGSTQIKPVITGLGLDRSLFEKMGRGGGGGGGG